MFFWFRYGGPLSSNYSKFILVQPLSLHFRYSVLGLASRSFNSSARPLWTKSRKPHRTGLWRSTGSICHPLLMHPMARMIGGHVNLLHQSRELCSPKTMGMRWENNDGVCWYRCGLMRSKSYTDILEDIYIHGCLYNSYMGKSFIIMIYDLWGDTSVMISMIYIITYIYRYMGLNMLYDF